MVAMAALSPPLPAQVQPITPSSSPGAAAAQVPLVASQVSLA